MTWEWAFLISVVFVSVTFFSTLVFKTFHAEDLNKVNHDQIHNRLEMMSDAQLLIAENMDAMKKEHNQFLKLADETKKMASETNLRKGFTPRGVRG